MHAGDGRHEWKMTARSRLWQTDLLVNKKVHNYTVIGPMWNWAGLWCVYVRVFEIPVTWLCKYAFGRRVTSRKLPSRWACAAVPAWDCQLKKIHAILWFTHGDTSRAKEMMLWPELCVFRAGVHTSYQIKPWQLSPQLIALPHGREVAYANTHEWEIYTCHRCIPAFHITIQIFFCPRNKCDIYAMLFSVM